MIHLVLKNKDSIKNIINYYNSKKFKEPFLDIFKGEEYILKLQKNIPEEENIVKKDINELIESFNTVKYNHETFFCYLRQLETSLDIYDEIFKTQEFPFHVVNSSAIDYKFFEALNKLSNSAITYFAKVSEVDSKGYFS